MYKAHFQTDDLKAAAEQSLGFRLRTLERIGGGSAINFKAVRDADGLPFLVKCFLPERLRNHDRLLENLKAVEGPKVPKVLFAETGFGTFAGCRVLCLSWSQGVPSDPGLLTGREWSAFLRDYVSFSGRMQTARPLDRGELSLRDCHKDALALCTGWRGRLLKPLLDAMHDEDLESRPDCVRVIHGDFHLGNVLLDTGAVTCFLDLENLCSGYAPEDLICYCMMAYRKGGGSDEKRRRLILERIGQAVRETPYSRHEWLKTINRRILKRLRRETGNFTSLGLWTALALARSAHVYDMLRRQIEAAYE